MGKKISFSIPTYKYMDRINKIVDWITLGVFWLILLYQLLYLIVPVQLYVIEKGLDKLSPLLAMIAFGLFLWDLVFTRWFLKEKQTMPLILTIVVLIISAILNSDYGIMDNLRAIIWQVVQMLVIFPLSNRFSKQHLQRIIKVMYFSILLFYLPAIIVSLSQFFSFTAYVVETPGEFYYCGFSGGRLRGIFNGIYFQGIFATLLGIVSVYYMVTTSKIWRRMFYGIVALLCFSQEILGEARSLQVGVAVAVATVTFLSSLVYLSNKKIGKRTFIRVLCAVLIAILCVFALRVARTGLEKGLKVIAMYVNKDNEAAVSRMIRDEGWLVEKYLPMYVATRNVQLDRNDSNDISTGRFDIWKDYIRLWKRDTKSVLFGGSQGNYRKIIWDKFPDTYLIEKTKILLPRLYLRELFYDTHNAYLSILVTSGIAGVLTMGAFFVRSVIGVLQYFSKFKKIKKDIIVLMILIITILVAAFFDSDLFFKCTSTSVVFWFLAGMLLKEIRETR